ncbi:AP-3 complex subunit beta [Neophaeococcomyces mojaviensis]|uniref:AP-3 complex subunit beta n=1 Tax=Neophaeococcomyces mojaviensis TaxID=3383035 RepID=A0ACC3AAL2_9EURO|nr:AP-3 complex subunit beta [Knufia sp. JES_112]
MESVSTISTMMDPARDLTLEAAQAIGLTKTLKAGSSSRTIPFAKMKALLDSRSDRDIIDGLRRVVGMIYMNKPCLPYFSSVVKNVANPNVEVKKLVYIYLLHYAESDPDLALLSVNAIQKSLTDQNPQIRAMALRTMAGMRVPVISQIVSLAIKRGIADLSPLVRKAAALAIPKCYQLDPNSLPQLIEYLSTLLGDKQYSVVGPAVQTFLQICPDRIDLIHKYYRGLVKKLVDMDEWSQLATMRLLLVYARKCFPRKKQKVTKVNKAGFYDDEADETEETEDYIDVIDSDLNSFLKSCQLLLENRNSAIVVSASCCLLYLGTPDHIKDTVGPLIALLRGPQETQQVVLPNIVLIALKHPQLFVPYTTRFLINTEDIPQIWRLKMELLTLIFPHANKQLRYLILNEFESFAYSTDNEQVQESVRAIGRCAQSDVWSSSRCFKVLLNQITSFDNVLVSEVLTVLRHLIQRDPETHRKTIVRLARNLDKTTSPEARATIIWLVGEFAGLDCDNNIAPDVLRILTKGFAEESEEAKQQIVLLAAKVYLQYLQEKERANSESRLSQSYDGNSSDVASTEEHQLYAGDQIPKIWTYLQALVRYDVSYDLRDRARLFRALLSNPASTQLASLLISAPKPVPHTPSPSENRQNLTLGSSTVVLGRDSAGNNGLPGYTSLPDWVEAGHEPDPKLRDENDTLKDEYVSQANRATNIAASKRLDEAIKGQGLENTVKQGTSANKGKTLDDWLEESEDDEEDEEDEGSEEASTEEGTESGEEESGSEEEETDDDGDDQNRGLIKAS